MCCMYMTCCCMTCIALSLCAEMERMKPVEVSQFSEHVRHMHQDRDKGFEIEYQVRLLPGLHSPLPYIMLCAVSLPATMSAFPITLHYVVCCVTAESQQ